MNIKPTKGKIFVLVLPKHKISKGGIILARTRKEIPHKCKVLAIGKNPIDKWGKEKELGIKVGDYVFVRKYRGKKYREHKTAPLYLFLQAEDVVCIEREVKLGKR